MPNYMEAHAGLQGETLPLLLDPGEYNLLIRLAAKHSMQTLTLI